MLPWRCCANSCLPDVAVPAAPKEESKRPVVAAHERRSMTLLVGTKFSMRSLRNACSMGTCDVASAPNLIVATTGADRTLQLEHERECRRLATVEVAKGVGVGSALVVLGFVVIVVSPSRRRVQADRVDKAASAVSARERRSEDGTQWWDGYRWLRIERDE